MWTLGKLWLSFSSSEFKFWFIFFTQVRLLWPYYQYLSANVSRAEGTVQGFKTLSALDYFRSLLSHQDCVHWDPRPVQALSRHKHSQLLQGFTNMSHAPGPLNYGLTERAEKEKFQECFLLFKGGKAFAVTNITVHLSDMTINKYAGLWNTQHFMRQTL